MFRLHGNKRHSILFLSDTRRPTVLLSCLSLPALPQRKRVWGGVSTLTHTHTHTHTGNCPPAEGNAIGIRWGWGPHATPCKSYFRRTLPLEKPHSLNPRLSYLLRLAPARAIRIVLPARKSDLPNSPESLAAPTTPLSIYQTFSALLHAAKLSREFGSA